MVWIGESTCDLCVKDVPFHYCHENLCKCGQVKAFNKNPIQLPQQRLFLVGILKALRILSCWGPLALRLVQNRVAPSHRPISTEQLIPFGALATTSYWVCVNAWLEKRREMPPMVTAPHHYTVGAKITVFWHQDHEGNKFNHAGTEEMSLGPGSWRKCSLKERKGHLDKSDGLGKGGGTGAVQVWETWC